MLGDALETPKTLTHAHAHANKLHTHKKTKQRVREEKKKTVDQRCTVCETGLLTTKKKRQKLRERLYEWLVKSQKGGAPQQQEVEKRSEWVLRKRERESRLRQSRQIA